MTFGSDDMLRFRPTVAAFAALLAWPAAAAPPRISFVRTVAPPHDLGGARVAGVVYAVSDTDAIDGFLEAFAAHANRGGILEVFVAADRRHLFGETIAGPALESLRREHPADVYLGVRQFTCVSTPESGEGSARASDGTRAARRDVWTATTCRARIDVIDAATGKRRLTFTASGEGKSSRVREITGEERAAALAQAARYAAINAAEGITPRRVRETVELDPSAPALEETIPLLEAERYAEARDAWKAALARGRASPSLHYNLGVISEALGDVAAAQRHFREALRLAPGEPRYRVEFDLFRKRNRISGVE